MASVDGLSFQVMAKSHDIRVGLRSRGFSCVLSSLNAIKTQVLKVSKTLRGQDKAEILNLKRTGMKFCVTFDEWTSLRNRHYLSIILHKKGIQFWNLGLIPIRGSATAVNLSGLVEQKLISNGLNLHQDIIALITDGTAVMTKIGRDASPTLQQLCFAHGLQLVVIDVLYDKKKNTKPTTNPEVKYDSCQLISYITK